MDVITNALPDRPIKVTPVKPPGTLSSLLIALFLLALAPVFWWLLGDGLAQDMFAPNDLQSARDVRVTEARCKTKAFIFTDCTIKTPGKTFEYLFIRSELSDSVSVLRSASKPSYLTTTIGQDQIVGRVVMMSALMLLFVGGGLAMLWFRRAQQVAAKGFAALDCKPMEAGLVTLKSVAAAGAKARRIDYMWSDGAKPGKAFVVWPNAIEPIVIGGVTQRFVAVRSKAGGTPMLVDQGFTAVALSQAEQAHLYATVNAYLDATPAT